MKKRKLNNQQILNIIVKEIYPNLSTLKEKGLSIPQKLPTPKKLVR